MLIIHSTKQQWPSLQQIITLRLVFAVWNLLTLVLVLWSCWLIANNSLGISNEFDLAGQSKLLAISAVVVLVWLYWRDRLKGKKPSNQNNLTMLTYCTASARKLILTALLKFYRRPAGQFGAKYLLAELLKQQETKMVLVRLGISKDDLITISTSAEENAGEVLATALDYAKAENSQINWSHLLKAIFAVVQSFKDLLNAKKISLDEALAVVDWTSKDFGYNPIKLQSGLLHDLFSPKRNLNKSWTAKPTPVLDRFSQNLTNFAKLGLLTSAKVRSKEVEQAIQALSRGENNSIVLVGEPGVGKTSIVGDLALRLLKGDVPALKDYKLIALNVGGMLASGIGFQQLFARAVNEASGSGNTILFIGNLDQFGKTKTSDGFDLSMILLSALKSNLQLIGTADPLNYKKYIESNSNLVAWFNRIDIEELDFNNAVLVLEDLSRKTESRQRVLITLEAIKTAVALAQRYIHLGQLPDKAIDLLDESAVYAARSGHKILSKNDVEVVMSSKTNVPIADINAEEKTKLSGLEEKIHSRLIGQVEAVNAVAEALKRARLGVSEGGKRPIGTFLFLGPTGVGKTELAKSLAWAYFGDETKMIRLDMGEYQTRDSVFRLLGAPATSGDLALAGSAFVEAVKKTPFAVVLLDEVEKAHPEILDVFLRVLDEGKLTDNLGNTIDFTHTIIIATSNAQARFIQEAVRKGMSYNEMKQKSIELLLGENFRPEFINRFDGIVMFKPLTESEIASIAKLKVAKIKKHLLEDKGIELIINDATIKVLAKQGYDPAFGARPLERVIREKIENKIANELLKSDTKQVQIDLEDLQ